MRIGDRKACVAISNHAIKKKDGIVLTIKLSTPFSFCDNWGFALHIAKKSLNVNAIVFLENFTMKTHVQKKFSSVLVTAPMKNLITI